MSATYHGEVERCMRSPPPERWSADLSSVGPGVLFVFGSDEDGLA